MVSKISASAAITRKQDDLTRGWRLSRTTTPTEYWVLMTSARRSGGYLMSPDPSHPIDKQIAAIALSYDLEVVTRNVRDFSATGVKLFNPFY